MRGVSAGLGPGAPLPRPSWAVLIAGPGALPSPPTDLTARAPLIGAGGLAYAVDGDAGVVACVRMADGALQWRAALGAPVAGALALGRGYVLVAPEDGTLLSLRADSGALDWNITLREAVLATPAASGDVALVSVSDGTLCAVNVSSAGGALWCAPTGTSFNSVVLCAAAVTLGARGSGKGGGGWDCSDAAGARALCDTVFKATLGEGTGGPSVLALDLLTGALLWSTALSDPREEPTTELVLDGGVLFYGAPRGLVALSAANGTRLWAQSPKGHAEMGLVRAAPTASRALGLLFASQQDSGMFGVRASDGLNAWFSPGVVSVSAGALDAQGVLYGVNVDGGLVAYNGSTGELLGSVALDLVACSGPSLDGKGGLLLVGGSPPLLVGLGMGGGGGGGGGGSGGGDGASAAAAAATAFPWALAGAAAVGAAAVALRRRARGVAPGKAVAEAGTGTEEEWAAQPQRSGRGFSRFEVSLSSGAAVGAGGSGAAGQPLLQRWAEGSGDGGGRRVPDAFTNFTEDAEFDFEAQEGGSLNGNFQRLSTLGHALDGDSFVLQGAGRM